MPLEQRHVDAFEFENEEIGVFLRYVADAEHYILQQDLKLTRLAADFRSACARHGSGMWCLRVLIVWTLSLEEL